MKLLIRTLARAGATLLVSALAVTAQIRTLHAQSAPVDSATRYAEAKRLSARADTLARGSVEDRRQAVDILRQAVELYSKGGAHRDAVATLNRVGVVFGDFGQQDSARSYYDRALPMARAVGDRSGEAMTLSNIGAAFFATGQQDSALSHYRRALAIAHAAGDRTWEARTLSRAGNVFTTIGRLDSALAYYRQSLPISRAISDRAGEAATLSNIGIAFLKVGQQDSALVHFRQALPIRRALGDRLAEARALINIGNVFINVGHPDSALTYDRQALAIFQAAGASAMEAGTLNNIGNVFSRTRQPDSALAYYRQAVPIFRARGDRATEAVTLDNIGQIFGVLGQPDSALVYYRQALPIRRAVGDRAGEAATILSIGNLFTIRQPDTALAYYRQALPISHAVGDRPGEAWTLMSIGSVLINKDEPDSALAYYRQALPISRGVHDRTAEAAELNNIGYVFSKIGRADSALAYYGQALPISHAIGDRALEAEMLGRAGAAYRQTARLDSALVYFARSAALLNAMSQRTGSDFNRLSYNETTASTYSQWTMTWLASGPHAQGSRGAAPVVNSATVAYGALAAAEQGRARALLDLMRDSTVYAEPATDFPAEGSRLAETLRHANSAGLIFLTTPDTLITWLISSNGGVRVFRRAIAQDTLAALVGDLRTALGAEDGNARLGVRGAEMDGDAKTTSVRRPVGRWRVEADEIAKILLPSALLQLLKTEREVVIVPQGALALVPFAALPAGASDEPLSAKLSIRYAPSLATLGQVQARAGLASGTSRSASLRQALVVGNPRMPEVTVTNGSRDRLAPLPGAETESRRIGAQLGTEPLTGAAATEAEVVRRLPKATIVHLATHGFAYSTEAKARNSFIALAPDSTHDGLLTVAKILDNPDLKLTADLVVLSACQTGLGNLRQAEGTVGLQRAFLAKGARSLLVSLWSVSDAATQKLMTGFYQHWLRDTDHPSKAEALRRSQEEVRRTPGFEHPRFWAAFQLAGAR